MADRAQSRRPSWPLHGWLGLILVAAAWPLNWLLPGMRTHLLFFPLWLGYVLVVDALVALRSGTSILTRRPFDLALLFAASVPVWWIFEALNERLQNWSHVSSRPLGDVEYVCLASLNFSPVLPAVFETAELVATFRRNGAPAGRARPPLGAGALGAVFAIGCAMLALLLAGPDVFYPLTWLALLFMLDPLCAAFGRPSLAARVRRGDWRPALSLAAGALICGVFWEMWNYWSDPKWVYRIPGLGFLPIFEMPVLGYLGYLPFGLELYPLAHLLLPRPPALRL
jgi:hypothetical protein